jgi:hypothetical protein
MPKYRVSSIDTGRVFYDEASIQDLLRILEIPAEEYLALYTCEIGHELFFELKPVVSSFMLKVERIE